MNLAVKKNLPDRSRRGTYPLAKGVFRSFRKRMKRFTASPNTITRWTHSAITSFLFKVFIFSLLAYPLLTFVYCFCPKMELMPVWTVFVFGHHVEAFESVPRFYFVSHLNPSMILYRTFGSTSYRVHPQREPSRIHKNTSGISAPSMRHMRKYPRNVLRLIR